MCGRFSISTPTDILKVRFKVQRCEDLTPNFNAAPTQRLPVILNSEPAAINLCQWGLIPGWAREPTIGNKMINARAETLSQKPSFRDPFKRHRCLVLADGFYEWKKVSEKKIPYRISMKTNEPFAFAGIWDEWRSPEGECLRSFAIITTEPNPLMKPLHHRMPVILSRENEAGWLQELDVSKAQKMLKPYPLDELEAYPVSSLVNSPRNNSAEVMKPA
jgi:putative SOS response-associated peptidase YedK